MLVDAGALCAALDLAGTDAEEGGKGSAVVLANPDVDLDVRVELGELLTVEGGLATVTAGVGQPAHLRSLGRSGLGEAEVVVVVELHERAVDRRRVVECVLRRKDVHRGLERLCVRDGVDPVHQGLGVSRVEDRAVVDPVPVKQVLFARGSVTDRLETVGLGLLDVVPPGQGLDRRDEEVLRLLLLRGTDTGHAGEVDAVRVHDAVRAEHEWIGQGVRLRLRGGTRTQLGVLSGVVLVHALHLSGGHTATRRLRRQSCALVGTGATRSNGDEHRGTNRCGAEESRNTHEKTPTDSRRIAY